MALRAADRRTGLLKALGYEDLSDHATLRRDVVWQSAVEQGEELASSPTLCRLEPEGREARR